MKKKLNVADAQKLMLAGMQVLSKIQSNGIRINLEYLAQTKNILQDMIDNVLLELNRSPDIKAWKKHWGDEFNIQSDDQLRWMLFEYLKFDKIKKTDSGKESVDVGVLEELDNMYDNDFLRNYMKLKKYQKAHKTYIKGLLVETNEDGFLRPFFKLNGARTYRSSSSNINFQNQPTRDPEIKKLVRTAFIPREGRQLVEFDYSGIEVRVAYMYHKDPVMREYLLDEKKDMHRDMAMQIYILLQEECNKAIRQVGKNKFVFPEFYGSYYKNVAPDLWKAITLENLHIGKDGKGIGVKEHLANHDIKTFDRFVMHIKDIETDFWYERFPVYTQWKKEWIERYKSRGFFDSFTGFRWAGSFRNNEIINFPIQGAAFHCLLFTLIEMQKWLEWNKMQSVIVGQIHDSIVMDAVPEELPAIYQHIQWIVSVKLPEYYNWISIPMKIEAEIAPVDEPWCNKKEIDISKFYI